MEIRLINSVRLAFLFGLILITSALYGLSFTGEKEEGNYTWTDIKELGIRGKGWKDDPLLYNRLPARAESMVRDAVWGLSHHTAGFYVRFRSNATSIMANWKLTGKELARGPAHRLMAAASALSLSKVPVPWALT